MVARRGNRGAVALASLMGALHGKIDILVFLRRAVRGHYLVMPGSQTGDQGDLASLARRNVQDGLSTADDDGGPAAEPKYLPRPHPLHRHQLALAKSVEVVADG